MWNIGSVDRVEVTTVCDNYCSGLGTNPKGVTVKRRGLSYIFNPSLVKNKPMADGTSAMLVDLITGDSRYRVLFDVGMNGEVLKGNMEKLGIDPLSINHVVISHGHPDHLGGLMGLLEARNHTPVPVCIHPETYSNRYILSPAGAVTPNFNDCIETKEECIAAGASFVEVTAPAKIGPGCMTTGNIPWNKDDVPFEPAPISIYRLQNGEFVTDKTPDEMALVVNIQNHGLLVISGCAHNGIVNTVIRAKAVSNIDQVYGVIGGFHLGFPGAPADMAAKTIEKFKEFGVKVVSPMHCTGIRATAEFMRGMPDEYVQDSLGVTFCFPFPKHEAQA